MTRRLGVYIMPVISMDPYGYITFHSPWHFVLVCCLKRRKLPPFCLKVVLGPVFIWGSYNTIIYMFMLVYMVTVDASLRLRLS